MADSGNTITQEQKMIILSDLDSQGYAVVPDVMSHTECDELSQQYKTWLETLNEGEFPKNQHSIIHGYGVAHMDPTWRIRLKVKPVFEALFGTEKLLSSTDGVAIQAPARADKEFDDGSFWFHCDQSCDKVGPHAIQGAVYLEEVTPEDYCLRVLEGSHLKHQEFFNSPEHARAKRKSQRSDFCRLSQPEMKWFWDEGCPVTPVAVPKGGMVLWDSRTIHDTKKPSKDRENQDRWRMLTFVSMAPALWARREDLALKKEAYRNLLTTAHWAAHGVYLLTFMKEGCHSSNLDDVCLSELPPIARTSEVKRLAGVERYDFKDGQSNGPPPPKKSGAGRDDQSDSWVRMASSASDQSHVMLHAARLH